MYKNEKCMPHGLPKEWKSVVHALQNVQQNPVHTLSTPNKTLAKPLLQTLDKPLQTSSKPLCPLRGLHSLHLNKSKRGEYNRGLALQAYLLYKINGSALPCVLTHRLVGAYLLNIQSKVFLVTLLSTPKEGNPAIQQTLAENLPFSFSPLRGQGGEHNQKLSLQRKVTYSFPLHVCTLRIRPSQSKQVPVQNN